MRRLDILTSPAYLIALAILVVNDFVLKPAASNWATGKLSDFAGLYVFAGFWMACFPNRTREIAVAVAVAFVFWKSSRSSVVIEAWNAIAPIHLARVVDPTDLLALPVVLLAAAHVRKRAPVGTARSAVTTLVGIVSLVSFVATSLAPVEVEVDETYEFESPIETFEHAFRDEFGPAYSIDRVSPLGIVEAREYQVILDSAGCDPHPAARMLLYPEGSRTLMHLFAFEVECSRDDAEADLLIDEFRHQIVARMRNRGFR